MKPALPFGDTQVPTMLPTTNRPQNAGASLNDDTSRLDGVAKVTGRAKYGRDVYPKDCIFVGFVRCPYGLADLGSFDADAAKSVPGVLEVEITGKGGQYHGQNVGHIAADSPITLQRALRALNAKWDRQPSKTGIADGLGEEPEIDADAAKILDEAELKLEAVYSTPVQTHACLETHGASIDHKGDSAIVYSSTQGTFAAREGLDAPLGLKQSQFEIVCEYIGGGFGSKLNGAGKEGTLAAKIAGKYKRSAWCFINRKEDQTDTGNRPSSRAHVRVGFKKDGTILGGEIRMWGGTGVGRGGGGMALPSGRYDLGDIKRKHTDVSFNAGGPRPMRAPGNPQAAFVEELMLDEIATLAGIDPLALRLRLDHDKDRLAMMEQGSKIIGWENRKPTGSQTDILRRGFGMGTTSWGGGGQRAEAEVVINRDGSVEARTGTQDIGTGQRTAMGVVAAEFLGVPLAAVTVRIGSSKLPQGPGSGGSGTAPGTAPAMANAAADAKKQLLAMIAQQANADVGEFDLKDGGIVRAGKLFVKWSDACAKISGDSITARANSRNSPFTPNSGNSHGAQFAEVEVDTETGLVSIKRVVAVQACGRVLCRKTAESQIIGAVIQGVSFALFENRVLDRTTGAMLNANLEMYKIVGPKDMPHIEPVLYTNGQTGVRSLGEPPTIPTAGAIACALFNALGKPVRHLPLTPDKVLAALAGVEGGVA